MAYLVIQERIGAEIVGKVGALGCLAVKGRNRLPWLARCCSPAHGFQLPEALTVLLPLLLSSEARPRAGAGEWCQIDQCCVI